MNSLALCSENLTTKVPIILEGVNINLDLIESSDPNFDIKLASNSSKVLVEKLAFSCNYRDKGNILRLSEKINKSHSSNPDKGSYSFFGSEFTGKIVEKGADVKDLDIGDHVVIDGSYPFRDKSDSPPGLPTNGASAYFEVFNESQLLSIPKSFPIEVAASISIGAQTVYSIIRRLNIKPKTNVLITSARSSTSMFAIAI